MPLLKESIAYSNAKQKQMHHERTVLKKTHKSDKRSESLKDKTDAAEWWVKSLQLKAKLEDHTGFFLSTSTIKKAWIQQGWTLQGTACCQLMRDANKAKWLQFAEQVLATGDTLDNVMYTEESSVSTEQYRCTCYRNILMGQERKGKTKPKHPLKVHVWAGIRKHWPTKICIFDGIMDADLYCEIL